MLPRVFCINATSPSDLDLVFAIRHSVLVEELARIPDKLVHDHHDAIATNFLAYVDGSPAGTVRVVRDCDLGYLNDTKFFIEKRVPLLDYRKADRNIVEVSRLAILTPHRKTRSGVVLALIACAYRYSQEHDVTDAFILANCEMNTGSATHRSPEIPKLFLDIGFRPIGEIREPGYYDSFGVYTVPMRLSREDLGTLAAMYDSLHVDGQINYTQLSPTDRMLIYHQVTERRDSAH